MTGRKWTTDLQEGWLKKQFASFIQADSAAMRKKFFAEVFIAWQKKWPDPAPTDEEVTAGGELTAVAAAKRKAKDKASSATFSWENGLLIYI